MEASLRKDEQAGTDLFVLIGGSKQLSDPDNRLYKEDDVLKPSQHIPLPAALTDRLQRCEIVDMGLFPEISRVWVIGDNRLWLWNYLSQTLDECPGFGNDAILTVALAVPKPGLFLDEIKYLLVVATDIEVHLLALQFNEKLKTILPIRTDFKMSLDDVICKKIVSSQYGRIFVGGHDGTLYEVHYDHVNPWSALIGLGQGPSGPADTQRTKCQKIKHSLFDWSLTRLLPSFLNNRDERMEEMALDNVRNLLHTVTFESTSWGGASLRLSSLFLGASGRRDTLMKHLLGECITSQNPLKDPLNFLLSQRFDLFEQARAFCASSRQRSLNKFGVSADHSKGPFSQDTLKQLAANGARVVVGMHVVPVSESSKIHLVVVLANGFRLFLRLITDERAGGGSNYKSFCETDPQDAKRPLSDAGRTSQGPSSDLRVGGVSSLEKASLHPPSRLEIVHVRPPPKRDDLVTPSAWDSLAVKEGKEVLVDNNAETAAARVKATHSYYSQGLFLASLCDLSGAAAAGDSLLGLCADVKDRTLSVQQGIISQVPAGHAPSFREALCQPRLPSVAGEVLEVLDIKESCAVAMDLGGGGNMPAQVLALYCSSFTPTSKSDLDAYRAPQPRYAAKTAPEELVSETPLLPYQALAPPGRPLGTGTQRNGLAQVVQLGEMALQHVPAHQHQLQRRVLVLSRTSLHVLRKRRPVDYLLDQLSRNENNSALVQFKAFYQTYGADEFCAMCLGIACGLPSDAGDTGLLSSDLHAAPPQITQQIRFRAIYLMIQVVADHDWLGSSSGLPSAASAPLALPAPMGGASSSAALGQVSSGDIKNPAVRGFVTLASRVLRPIWLRVVSSDFPEHEAKPLATFWSPELTTSILAPLLNLIEVMVECYPAEVNSDPSVRLAAHAHAPAEAESQRVANARVFRLLTRAAQGLKLLRLLLVAEREWRWGDFAIKVPSRIPGVAPKDVKWSQWVWSHDCFKGVTFRRFVVDQDVHERVSAFLTDLVATMGKRRDAADKNALLMQSLDAECFMFYGLGDRKTNEAKAKLLELKERASLSLSASSRETQALAKEVVALMTDAARYWRTRQRVERSDVTRSQGKSDSDLETCCAELFAQSSRYEACLDGIVDACMAAADNFRSAGQGQPFGLAAASRSSGRLSSGAAVDGGQERGLYHGGEVRDDSTRDECCLICYDALIKYICRVRGRGQSLSAPGAAAGVDSTNDAAMSRMIQRAIQAAGDSRFHAALCRSLLEGAERSEKHLLELRDPFVDEYLRGCSRADKWEKLFQWYCFHKQHRRAAEVMYEQAVVRGDDEQFNSPAAAQRRPSVETRIRYLKLSVSAATEFCASAASGGSVSSAALETRARAEESLQLAEIQLDALRLLESPVLLDPSDPSDKDVVEQLSSSFVSKDVWTRPGSGAGAGESYYLAHVRRKACECPEPQLAAGLWAVLLRIVKVYPRGRRDPADVLRLWKCVIYRSVTLPSPLLFVSSPSPSLHRRPTLLGVVGLPSLQHIPDLANSKARGREALRSVLLESVPLAGRRVRALNSCAPAPAADNLSLLLSPPPVATAACFSPRPLLPLFLSPSLSFSSASCPRRARPQTGSASSASSSPVDAPQGFPKGRPAPQTFASSRTTVRGYSSCSSLCRSLGRSLTTAWAAAPTSEALSPRAKCSRS